MTVFPESMNKIDVSDYKKSLQVIESYINYMCERVDHSINNMTTNLASQGDLGPYVTEQLDELTSTLNQIGSSLNSMVASINGLASRTTIIESSLTTINETLTSLDERVKALEEEENPEEGGTT